MFWQLPSIQLNAGMTFPLSGKAMPYDITHLYREWEGTLKHEATANFTVYYRHIAALFLDSPVGHLLPYLCALF